MGWPSTIFSEYWPWLVPHSSKELLWFQWHFWPLCHLVATGVVDRGGYGLRVITNYTFDISRFPRRLWKNIKKTRQKNWSHGVSLEANYTLHHLGTIGHHVWCRDHPHPRFLCTWDRIIGTHHRRVAREIPNGEMQARCVIGRWSLIKTGFWWRKNDHRFVDLESDCLVKKSEVPQILVFTTFVLIGLHEAIMTFSSTRPANSWRWTCMIQTSGQVGLGNLEIWEWKRGHHSQCSSPEAVWL